MHKGSGLLPWLADTADDDLLILARCKLEKAVGTNVLHQVVRGGQLVGVATQQEEEPHHAQFRKIGAQYRRPNAFHGSLDQKLMLALEVEARQKIIEQHRRVRYRAGTRSCPLATSSRS